MADVTPPHSAFASANERFSAPAFAMTIRSAATWLFEKSDSCRKHSRQTRLIRFRTTAFPILRVITNPSRQVSPSGPAAYTKNRKWAEETRRPIVCAWTKSPRLRTRRFLPNEDGGWAIFCGAKPRCYFLYVLTVRRQRPFRRRFERTCCPPRLDIRARKPWVRTRRIL